jgi:hypothetical protein
MAKAYAQHAFAGQFHLETRYTEPNWEWFVLDARQTSKTLFSGQARNLEGAKTSACHAVGLSFADWLPIGPELEIPD